MGLGLVAAWAGSVVANSVLPYPSRELIRISWAKARVTLFLKWRELREAGFTEQRVLPALVSGRITGQCHSDPLVVYAHRVTRTIIFSIYLDEKWGLCAIILRIWSIK